MVDVLAGEARMKFTGVNMCMNRRQPVKGKKAQDRALYYEAPMEMFPAFQKFEHVSKVAQRGAPIDRFPENGNLRSKLMQGQRQSHKVRREARPTRSGVKPVPIKEGRRRIKARPKPHPLDRAAIKKWLNSPGVFYLIVLILFAAAALSLVLLGPTETH